MRKKQRTGIDILYDTLNVIHESNGINSTNFMYKSNLWYHKSKKILDFYVKNGFVKRGTDISDLFRPTMYDTRHELTEKGLQTLSEVKKLKSFLRTFREIL